MIPDRFVLSVPLTPRDAIAAMKLCSELDAISKRDESVAVTIGAVNEIIVHGLGETELEQVVDYLKRRAGCDFDAGAPQVAYRETITKTIEWGYTHKKQIGGAGQYANVKIRFEPGETGSGFRFENAMRDNNVPAAFIPAVERGLAAARQHGPIADFPVADLKCTLIDGDYHDIDSNAMTFEVAAHACLREALPKAQPRLLEPIMAVVVLTPEKFLGQVIGDLNRRRGSVEGMESYGAIRAIMAMVPVSNLFGYEIILAEMTRGRARYLMAFERYDFAPGGPGGDEPFAPAAALR